MAKSDRTAPDAYGHLTSRLKEVFGDQVFEWKRYYSTRATMPEMRGTRYKFAYFGKSPTSNSEGVFVFRNIENGDLQAFDFNDLNILKIVNPSKLEKTASAPSQSSCTTGRGDEREDRSPPRVDE